MTARRDTAPSTGSGGTGRLITLSATYGSGGSLVAPALARRLDVPCLQRLASAGGMCVEPESSHERLSPGEARATPVPALLASLSHALPAGPTQSAPAPGASDLVFRRQAEAGIHRLAAAGEGVILGRGAAVVLGMGCGYHVRLDGPPESRLTRAVALEGVDPEEARAQMRAADGARTAYVERMYGVDPADPSLYHLVIDSTATPLEAVVELILKAASDAASG